VSTDPELAAPSLYTAPGRPSDRPFFATPVRDHEMANRSSGACRDAFGLEGLATLLSEPPAPLAYGRDTSAQLSRYFAEFPSHLTRQNNACVFCGADRRADLIRDWRSRFHSFTGIN